MNLHDDRLLNIIKYNDFLQQKLDINLERDIKSSYIFDRIFSYLGKKG